MSEYFASSFGEWLLRASAQATVLIAVVLVVQALFGKRLGARGRFALWYLVLARLLLPSVPTSSWSVFNYAPVEKIVSAHPGDFESAPAAPLPVRELSEEPFSEDVTLSETVKISDDSSFEWLQLFPILWLVGAVILSVRVMREFIKVSRLARQSRPLLDAGLLELLEECKRRLGIRRPVQILESHHFTTPTLIGIRSPRIQLPAGLVQRFDRDELRLIFLHELGHVKRHDIALNWLCTAAQVLHWFNPVVWFAVTRMQADREMACDALVLRAAGEAQRHRYGDAIIRLLEQLSNPSPRIGAVGIVEERSQIKERIRGIARFRVSSRWSVLVLPLLAGLAVLGLTDAQVAKIEPSAAAPEVAPAESVLLKASNAQPFPAYSWSESSPTVRVSKELLKDVSFSFQSVLPKPGERKELTVSEEFINLFSLSTSQVEEISRALVKAGEEFNASEMAHLEALPEGEVQNLQPHVRLHSGDQSFPFRLKSFPNASVAIREKLRERVAKTIGAERTDFFFKKADVLNTENPVFTSDPESNWNQQNQFTYVFVLPASKPGAVDLYRVSRGLRSGSSERKPWPQSMDRYAPESLKPALARWRDRGGEADAKSARAQDARTVETSLGSPLAGAVSWNEGAPYLDIPKGSLRLFNLPGLSADDTLSAEMAAVLGLTDREQEAVMDLYTAFKQRFRDLERAHFRRVEPTKNAFVIEAFPQESSALRLQWNNKLKKLIGPTRGELLDTAIRNNRPSNRREPNNPIAMRRPPARFQGVDSWLHGGTDLIRIEFKVEVGPEGRERFNYEHQSGGRGSRGSGTSPEIPKRWQHLITPELLGAKARIF